MPINEQDQTSAKRAVLVALRSVLEQELDKADTEKKCQAICEELMALEQMLSTAS